MVEEGVLDVAAVENVGKLVGAFWAYTKMFVDSEIELDMMNEND